jgi:4-alpha-glucanotransferase
VSTEQTKSTRAAGILLHPTSLPGRFGIGDLGPAAYGWADALVRAKQKWWQILPLGPTGFGDSPYQCFSAFAGNPYLVSPELLVREGLIDNRDLEGAHFPADRVDYGPVIEFKNRLLRKAWEHFQARRDPGLASEFETFCRQHAAWLEDFALFMAIKEAQGGKSWQEWPAELVGRQPAALDEARRSLAGAIGLQKFRQFLFFRQWGQLKHHANEHGIQLLGDAPIFVASDSADVWANPELFLLDERRRPRFVAGVPPDYFSKTGQLWGNPLYDWDALRRQGYRWWIDRLRATLEQVDRIRLDHFRGFAAFWRVPAGMPTAEKGDWITGPGAELFETVRAELGGLPLVAEDLGLITPDVDALRDQFNLPGMRILQFAFGGAVENRFLPHNYTQNSVVYTGTHDNDTTRGWFGAIAEHERDHVRRYLGRDGRDIAWDLIRLAWMSVADHAFAPLQDVLDLGPEARMNLPGQAKGNWDWRFHEGQLTEAELARLAELTDLYGR